MEMWGEFEGICDIIPITNAQNKGYWTDSEIEKLSYKGQQEIHKRKERAKAQLFELVADQTGAVLDPNVLQFGQEDLRAIKEQI